MFKWLLKLVFICTISTSLFSCSVTSNKMEMLEKSMMSYERAIRWGEFTRAKTYHKKDSALSDIERRRLKLYRISGYSIIQNQTVDQHNAYLLVEIKYYKNDRPSIKNVTVKQHWKRDKEGKVWYLDSPFPKFR